MESKITYQNPNIKISLREMMYEVEIQQLSPLLHHQHTQTTVTEPLEMLSRADHQDPLLKLHAVLDQEHNDIQQLTLKTVRQEPC